MSGAQAAKPSRQRARKDQRRGFASMPPRYAKNEAPARGRGLVEPTHGRLGCPGAGPGSVGSTGGSARLLLRAVDQLDVGHRRVVAVAETALQDAQVAARAVGVARAEHGE